MIEYETLVFFLHNIFLPNVEEEYWGTKKRNLKIAQREGN